ncbi:hypothetical protein BKA65DRAFT_400861 [Rhexocercosporidium sp. MPI-PUGE-AT-0058]|nr:hypothetical protein BKA65DRAFT_400861 [Rhexocercosporidium sp. MPI-PUGE-AT-0058]
MVQVNSTLVLTTLVRQNRSIACKNLYLIRVIVQYHAPPAIDGTDSHGNVYFKVLPVTASGKRSPISTVLISRDKTFVERQDVFRALELQFSHSNCHNRAVLTGLGGVGKSQVAIEYSYRLRERDPDLWVFWVYASTAERFEGAYRSIAATLDLPGADDPKTDVLVLVSRWLSNTDNGRWLMILDNADDIDVFQKTQDGSTKGNSPNLPLSSYIPQSITGSVLVTTRDRSATSWLSTGYTSVIPINLMSPEEADQLLCARIHKGLSTEFDRTELVKELDYLPLAITQAAAYISANALRTNVSKYLVLYRHDEQSQSRLLDKDSGDLRRDPSVPNSVIRTWEISFNQLKRNQPQAAELLSLMAMLDRQGIPEFLLNVQYPNPLDLEDALAPLDEFSLITVEKGGKSFEMHRLIQLATRKWVEQYGNGKRWWSEAIGLVSKAFPNGSYSNWKTCETLSPHALQVLRYVLDSRQSMLDRASLLHNMSWYNWIQGRYEVARAESKESLAIHEQCLQHNDEKILASRGLLASVLSSQGKYADAEAMNRQTLAIWEEVLGKTHPDTLTIMNNLALVLNSQGKYADAEAMNRQTLAIREEVLGKTHPDTLMTMSNLAGVLARQGKYADAEAMNRQTLAIREEVLGKTHPDTLTTMNNLAGVLARQGKYADAEAMNRQTLAIWEEVLGKTHPDTLMTMSNLALVLNKQGKYADAEAMNRQTLAIWEEVLGKTHPDTLTTMSNLALVLARQGKYADAEAMNRQTLQIRGEVLGKTHPDTLTSVYCLAHLLQKKEEYEEALILYQRACTGYQLSLGSEHPTTKACVNHYSVMLNRFK